MSKHTHNSITAAIVLSGLFLLLHGSTPGLRAMLSPADGHQLHAAPVYILPPESVATELLTGALLVVLGLVVHALFTIRRGTGHQPAGEGRSVLYRQVIVWRAGNR